MSLKYTQIHYRLKVLPEFQIQGRGRGRNQKKLATNFFFRDGKLFYAVMPKLQF